MLPFATTWIDLEGFMLSEISQIEEQKYCMVSPVCGIKKIKQTSKYHKKKKKPDHRYREQTSGYQWGEGRGVGRGRRLRGINYYI